MFPCDPIHDGVYREPSNSVPLREARNPKSLSVAFGINRSDLADLIFGELRVVLAFSARSDHSVSGFALSHVLGMSPGREVPGINAVPDITGVHNRLPEWDGSLRQNEGQPVGGMHLSVMPHLPVSERVKTLVPENALISFSGDQFFQMFEIRQEKRLT